MKMHVFMQKYIVIVHELRLVPGPSHVFNISYKKSDSIRMVL